MTNSSGLGGSYNATSASDTVKDLEQFLYFVEQGQPSVLTVTATSASDAVYVDNCSPCPIKSTITLRDLSDKTGATTSTRCVYLKAGQARVYDWSGDVVLDVTIEEADQTSVTANAVTSSCDVTGIGNASKDLLVVVDFFNS